MLLNKMYSVYCNRTLENYTERSNTMSYKPETTEQLLSTNDTNKIKRALNLLRSSIITPIDMSKTEIKMCDFTEALKKVVPSSKREGFATVPNVTWDDIGSLKKIRQELHMAMLVNILRRLVSYYRFIIVI